MSRSFAGFGMVLVACVLAFGLCAGTAFADTTLVAGDPAGEPAPAPTTETVWVLKKIGSDKLTYNKNGLLSKMANSQRTVAYTYKSKTARIVSYNVNKAKTGKVSYDAQGRMTKIVNGEKGAAGYQVRTYQYNAKGRIATERRTGSMYDKATYTYDKYGRVKTMATSNRYNTQTYRYTYDKQGNLLRVEHGVLGYNFVAKTDYANTYNGQSLLKKRVIKLSRGNDTTKFTYAKATVPIKYADAVKAQQWALLNGAKTFDLPIVY